MAKLEYDDVDCQEMLTNPEFGKGLFKLLVECFAEKVLPKTSRKSTIPLLTKLNLCELHHYPLRCRAARLLGSTRGVVDLPMALFGGSKMTKRFLISVLFTLLVSSGKATCVTANNDPGCLHFEWKTSTSSK